jgi:DNA-binding MarR family transcriptional regulator
MLDRLERSGHMHRARVESDRRAVRVEITDQARSIGASMFELLAAHMHEVLATYDEEGLARMAELMERLSEAARAAGDAAGSPPAH